MTPDQFVYWMQGFVELADTETLSKTQWQVVKDHLKLVLTKVTPDYPKYTSIPGAPVIGPITPFYTSPGWEMPIIIS